MTLPAALAARLAGRVVVVGVGNPERGDDGAGCLVANWLCGAPGLRVIEAEEVPESFIGEIVAAGPDTVVLVDAVDLGAEPGSVAVVEKDEIAAGLPTTHRMPLSLLMEVVRRRTSADVLLLAIQPSTLAFGAPPSPEVAASARRVADMLALLARGAAAPRSSPSTVAPETESPA